jgi:putative protease
MKMNAELMAPAGSYESLQAAIQGGADSVYFGIEQLNMRARSSNNFTLDDLKEIASRCNEAGIKSYLTVNTVIYDHDLQLMKRIVKGAKDCGITAIIASDQAVLMAAKELQMPVHISTQANVSNIEAVKFYSFFADTIVLARELSLKQVEEITRQIRKLNICGPSGKPIRIEIFVHGALCMAVSGKCYMSLHSHYASANRGACVQNCRRTYVVSDKEEGIEFEVDNEYIFSAKDLCTIDFLDKIMDAGVEILKIEGRGRSSDYVYTVTKCYKEAIVSLEEKTFNREKVAAWKEKLATVFNRGFWDGYYLGRKMGEWTDGYGSKATLKKIYLGKGNKYFPKAGAAEFLMETHRLKRGDTILVTGPSTGVIQKVVDEIRMDDESVDEVKKGDVFSIKLSEKIRPSDKLYKLVSADDTDYSAQD